MTNEHQHEHSHHKFRTYHRIAAVLSLMFLALMIWDAGWNNTDWFAVLLILFCAHLVIQFILLLIGRDVHPCACCAEEKPAPQPVAKPQPVKETTFQVVKPKDDGPFVYNGYTLHRRMTTDKGGGKRYFYFFAKNKPKSGEPCKKPEGYHVGVNKITNLPFLKSGKGPDGEVLKEAQEFKPEQCQALTGNGGQCKNSNRQGSKYCATHKGYQPPAASKVNLSKTDTKPKSSKAKDTLPSTRKPRAS